MATARRAFGSAALVVAVVLAVGVVTAPASPAQPASSQPWLNTHLSPQERARLLLQQMTLAEKIDLMTGNQGEAPYAFYNAPIPRLGIPALKMADAGGGVAPRGWSLPGTDGHATAMPSEMALGATWSPGVAREFATVVAEEVRETGQNVLLAPDTDVDRVPWGGRVSESEGEDPFLNGDLNSVYTDVLQAHNVIATLKHYTANNQETNRGSGQNSIMSERTLREVYALAFEMVVKRAGLGAVMCSFNKINGQYSCQNAMTLRTVLKGQIGFSGFVMSDFGALHDMLPGLSGGDDMETGTTTVYDGALLAAVQSGQASLALVDDAVLRILTTMFRIGVFDTDYTPTSIPVAAHDAVARAVEDKAITLLKNDGVLPLTGSTKSIAVIGADANILAAESGSAYVSPTTGTPALEGITARAGSGATVTFTPGNDPVNAASMIETEDMTAVPSSVLSPASGTGPGLTAQYWHNTTFSGAPAVARVERQVNYDLGFASTFPGWLGAGTQVPVPPFNFFLEQQSVKYDGFLTPPATGGYRLALTGWGDATLSLDGTTLIDMTGQAGRRAVTSPVLHLAAGHQYALHIAYRATHPLTNLQPGTLLLQWSTPAGVQSPGIAQAVAAAKHADVAVVYVRDFETEERDRVLAQAARECGPPGERRQRRQPAHHRGPRHGRPGDHAMARVRRRCGADVLRRAGAGQRARGRPLGRRHSAGQADDDVPDQRARSSAQPGEPLGRHRRPQHHVQRGRERRIQRLRRRGYRTAVPVRLWPVVHHLRLQPARRARSERARLPAGEGAGRVPRHEHRSAPGHRDRRGLRRAAGQHR